jgi:hypothetical protein
MKTITKKKDGKERTIDYTDYPCDLQAMVDRYGEEGVYALADSALTIRLQAVTAGLMDDKTDADIVQAFDAFRPGQGHGGASRKQSLIASILDADQLGIFTEELLKTMKIAQLEDILQRLSK